MCKNKEKCEAQAKEYAERVTNKARIHQLERCIRLLWSSLSMCLEEPDMMKNHFMESEIDDARHSVELAQELFTEE